MNTRTLNVTGTRGEGVVINIIEEISKYKIEIEAL